MRTALRTLACLIVAASATAVVAAPAHFLDRNGVLWTAAAAQEGLVLTGQRDGQELVRTTVPFVLAMNGTSDTQIQVASDEVTGKVVVVWQRNWSETASEIMLAVWRDGTWERTEHLTPAVEDHARFPVISLSQVATAVPEPSPDDPDRTVSVRDSFLHVVWWEGAGEAEHGSYALLHLSAAEDENDALLRRDLDRFIGIGMSCDGTAPPEILEHPLFADQASRDRAMVFFGSRRSCLFFLAEVRLVLEAPAQPDPESGLVVTAQRKRHVPVFGVRRAFSALQQLNLEGARITIGNDLQPVAYRVVGPTIEYVVATDEGWSPQRTLAVDEGLTLDQAIPLIQGLAR
jgi:hypothetical protein